MAVQYLGAGDRQDMLPILEIMPPKASVTLLASVAATLEKNHANGEPFGLDLRHTRTGGVPIGVLAKLCSALRNAGYGAFPTINSADLFAQPTQVGALAGMPEVVLRMRLQTLTLASCAAAVASVRKAVGKGARLHVVFDFEPIGEVPTAPLSALATPFVQSTLSQGDADVVALAGGSFPITLQGIPLGTGNLLPRREWHAWLHVRHQPGCAPLCFGDYAVTNPDLPDIVDPRALNASAAIRYALDDQWWLLRGRGTRTAGFAQYNTLCRVLIADARYHGAAFSYGDGRYFAHAQPGASSGNLTTWRRDATNHHLVQTMRRLAQLMPASPAPGI